MISTTRYVVPNLARRSFATALPRVNPNAFTRLVTKRPVLDSRAFKINSFAFQQTFLSFSTNADTKNDDVSKAPGAIEKPLKHLDMRVVRQIKAELMEVDANFDGRLDADELKHLLRKHSDQFTDAEILELSEYYYAAKTGGSVTFDSFIEALDNAAGAQNLSGDERLDHFRESGRHPLGFDRKEVLEYTALGPPRGHYTEEELDVKLTHTPPTDFVERLAFNAVKIVRFFFDTATGWRNDNITVSNILNRTIFLETIAAVPGMVAAIIRHFRSLRSMKADGGYVQLFLEEANNERMHLLTFVRMKDPNFFFRAAVVVGQFGFGAFFALAYAISPRFCHRFVGYVEEEACSTYTKIIKAIESAPEGSELAAWRTQKAPALATAYWKLGEEGTVLDMMYSVRADEAEHRDVNHLVAGVKPGQINPLYDPESKLDMMLSKYVSELMKRGKD